MTAKSKRLVLLRAGRTVANFSRRLAMRRPVMIHDQARAPLPGHVQPYPLHEDTDPETRLAQEFEVHGGPCEPGEKTAEAQPAGLQDRETFADDRHRAFVEIAKRGRCGLAVDAAVNHLARIAALLHRDLSDAGQRPAVLIERGRIPDDEDLRVARHADIRLDANAARAIRRRLQPLAGGRGGHPRGPDHSLAHDALTT